MEAAPAPEPASPLGRITISNDAIGHIVGRVAAEADGVVGLASSRKRFLSRNPLRQGITVRGSEEEGVSIALGVIAEHGLDLAGVASTLRDRVAYEVQRLTGLRVASVEVRIEDVRRSSA